MKWNVVVVAGMAVIAGASAGPSLAQPRPGWGSQIDGLAVYQGDADLSKGGSFTASRAFLRARTAYVSDSGTTIGLSVSLGRFDYEFSQAANQPWTGIRDIRVSLPVRFRVGETASAFLSPQLRWDYQDGASASDGTTYGIFAGIAWKVSNRLTIGPAFGAYSQLAQGGTEFFPALLIDWDINERWNLNTGTGLGATRGPGLTLSYALNDSLNLSATVRSERVRFRLDGVGLAAGGVGEDRSIPAIISVAYQPNPGFSLTAFAGAEFDGQLTLDDANGARIDRQSYETVPIVGVAFRVRF